MQAIIDAVRRAAAVAVLAAMVVSCERGSSAPSAISPPVIHAAPPPLPEEPGEAAPVVRIGSRAYTRDDFRFKAAVEGVYFGTPVAEPSTAGQVLETALMEAVLERHGIRVTDAMLEAEAARVDRETQEPVKLAQIKALFGGDTRRYREVFLEPILVNQRLFDYLHTSEATQGDRRRTAQALHQSARSQPARFKEWVLRLGAEYVEQTQKPEERYTPAELERYRGDVPGLDGELVASCLRALPVGEVCPKVTEDRHLLKVVRLVARRAGEYQIEVGVIRKRTFEEWFPGEARKVPVEWRDETLRARLAPLAGAPGGRR